jgi:hypothetical protein
MRVFEEPDDLQGATRFGDTLRAASLGQEHEMRTDPLRQAEHGGLVVGVAEDQDPRDREILEGPSPGRRHAPGNLPDVVRGR